MEALKDFFFNIPAWRLAAGIFFFAVFIIAEIIFNESNSGNPRRRKYSTDINQDIIFLILKVIIISCCILVLYFDVTPAQYLQYDMAGDIGDRDGLSARIETISKDLEKSAKELDAIQEQLESRISTVEELKKEAEIAESVLSLSEEQVNAVQAKLNQELEASSGKSFWVNVLISAFFFTLGLVVTPVFNFIRRRLQKAPPQKPIADRNGLTEEEVEKFHRLLDELARREFTTTPK